MRQAKTIKIEIVTDGAAFDEHECGEVSRILRMVCRDICEYRELPPGHNGVYDINGNTTGNVLIELLK